MLKKDKALGPSKLKSIPVTCRVLRVKKTDPFFDPTVAYIACMHLPNHTESFPPTPLVHWPLHSKDILVPCVLDRDFDNDHDSVDQSIKASIGSPSLVEYSIRLSLIFELALDVLHHHQGSITTLQVRQYDPER